MTEVATTNRDTLLAYKAMLEAQVKRQKRRKIDTYYPAIGPLRRELYPQHMEFFRLGKEVPTRAFMAGNRVGKTEGAGGYEMACHLTGKYPDWWPGRKFLHPVDAWAAGDTKETVRDIIQLKMLGPEPYGTGMIPGDDIVHVAKRPNSNGAVDYVMVKNVFGGNSRLGFKSYDQGREAFQGTEKHVVWLDEESNDSIRSECVMRLMTTDGLLIETFTPLRGLTPIVMTYLGDAAAIPDGRVSVAGTRALVMAGWDDVPHLTEQQKERLAGEGAVHLRQARSKGVPSIGIGAIYPVPEEEILVDDFAIPKHWPRAYGLDVGWNRTAAIWGAIDRESDTAYLYSAHYQGQQEPSTHVAAINARGRWMTGAIDPASRGRSQKDGEQLLIIYRDLGLTLIEADNSRESGLYEVHQRLATGRLKVFKSLHDWRREYRIYRRDEKGQIVKVDDHLMDACVVGDTMVCTDSGPVRIADLVGREGKVFSRDGALCRFIGARKTIADTRVVTVRFDDGSSVTCTPDHPFLTPSGWVRADCMAGLDAYNGVSQSIQAAACASKLSRSLSSLLMGFATIVAAGTSSAMARGFIGWCGRRITGAKSRLGSMFTMTMRTGPTTSPAILFSSAGLSTSGIISRATSEACRVPLSRPQRPGTALTQEGSGIGSTTPSTPDLCTSAQPCNAVTAARCSMGCSTGSPSSALADARRSIVSRLALTMSNALVWCAAAVSWRIATARKPAARAHALLRCQSVEEAGRADVYCLTVPATSSFCVASGAVVHNTRYLVVSGLDLAKVEIEEGLQAFRRLRGLA